MLLASECGGKRQAATPGRVARVAGPVGLFNDFLEIGKVDAHAFEEGRPVGTELRQERSKVFTTWIVGMGTLPN